MPRGPQKKEKFVHINLYVTRRTYEYFDKAPNMSKVIRDFLDDYVATKQLSAPNIVRGVNPTQEQ